MHVYVHTCVRAEVEAHVDQLAVDLTLWKWECDIAITCVVCVRVSVC